MRTMTLCSHKANRTYARLPVVHTLPFYGVKKKKKIA